MERTAFRRVVRPVILPEEKTVKTCTVSYRDGLLKDLASPAEAAAYLDAALENGGQNVFLIALRDPAEAREMAALAKSTKLHRARMQQIFRVFCG
jgi:DNA-binding phage protein